ncbi:exosome complex component CSL4 [Kwoniella heveanensis CBS 569]|uniref:CND01650-like protein n=1 Tax=Kwoniella heveanensis TaxID=89924 RepID=D1MBL3_9TREE|nr:CND01650-like protein [Kwoniella heveanensis]OCF41480.1 exosome complex component CSL4 [Kwoniella heveanensis CBS 569]
MSSSALLLPGQPLPAELVTPPLPQCGSGCYQLNGRILASVIGRPRRDGAVVSVIGREESGNTPDVGSIVIGTVSRLTPQQAHVTLTTSNDRPLPETSEEFVGVIRVGDVRLTERDKVKMGECFRLGDLVKAKVLSLGDARSYYLSTAANELGVVYAKSEAGNPLLPLSYQEMEDEITGRVERRKVAKPEGI